MKVHCHNPEREHWERALTRITITAEKERIQRLFNFTVGHLISSFVRLPVYLKKKMLMHGGWALLKISAS